jgi:asparagine synthase (glutamine-hydrolysing)
MCGIAGIVASEPDETAGKCVRAATAALAHRGPDGYGFWRLADNEGGLCTPEELDEPAEMLLGHRRLSIVDIDGGAEPMLNDDGTVCVVFNGEIYNHPTLRRELEGLGHRYQTRCDTETLIHGWEEWQEDLFGRLNGIFAFALVDVRRRELLLVRDPVGVKPLYLGTSGRRTWFTSELAAAREAGLLQLDLSPEALKLFLTFRFIPSPNTIEKHAWKVPPGHYVRLSADTAGAEPVFLPYECRLRSTAAPRGRHEWGEALIAELELAVERQLMADVPLASLLSGGIDSSLVTQMMARHLAYPPQTFGIGMRSEGDGSEVFAAKQAALALKVPHASTLVEDAEYIEGWPAAMGELGEPIAHSSALMVRMVCREAGRLHKVALCGQGADELLGGYPRHMTERLYRIGRFAPWLGRGVAQLAFGAESAHRVDRILSAADRTQRYVEIFSVLPGTEIDELVRGSDASASELARAVIRRWLPTASSGDPLNDLLRVDARMSLADDLLTIGDHCAMRESVELRVPFLDLELLELIERMPSAYKVSTLGERKWLYRQAAGRHLPRELAQRLSPPTKRLQRKRGFSQPLAKWFDTEQGLLARHDDWTQPLYELPAFSASRLPSSLGQAGAPGFARRRSVLYALAQWLGDEANRKPSRVAA